MPGSAAVTHPAADRLHRCRAAQRPRHGRLRRLAGDPRRHRARRGALLRPLHLRLGDRPVDRLVRARRGRVAALARASRPALWFVWVAITSFAAGGYLAGRLRRTRARRRHRRGRDPRRRARRPGLGDRRARRRRARGRRRHRGRRRRRLRRRHRGRRPRPRRSAATSTSSARRLLGSGGAEDTGARQDVVGGDHPQPRRRRALRRGPRLCSPSIVAERTGQTPEEAGAAVDAAVAAGRSERYDAALEPPSRSASPPPSAPSSSPRR